MYACITPLCWWKCQLLLAELHNLWRLADRADSTCLSVAWVQYSPSVLIGLQLSFGPLFHSLPHKPECTYPRKESSLSVQTVSAIPLTLCGISYMRHFTWSCAHQLYGVCADLPSGGAALPKEPPSKYQGAQVLLPGQAPAANIILAFEYGGGWRDIQVGDCSIFSMSAAFMPLSSSLSCRRGAALVLVF